MNNFWPGWRELKPAFSDPRVLWDAGKLRLKELAVSHSVSAARERKRDKFNLEREFKACALTYPISLLHAKKGPRESKEIGDVCPSGTLAGRPTGPVNINITWINLDHANWEPSHVHFLSKDNHQ